VVVHLRPDVQSHLAEVLARATMLPVVAARNDTPMRPGTIYVAVPDLHLLVQSDGDHGVIRLVRGPRENRSRPSVDPLFRSAALGFGPRVIGVVLSGALDDGTAGLWTVKDRGGIAVVQDPHDAAVASMPASALLEVAVDHVVSARELGPLLGRLAHLPVPAGSILSSRKPPGELEREVGITAMDEELHAADERYGSPSRFSCPDCGGVLWDVTGEGPLHYKCEVGHAHSGATLAEAQTEAVEAALWSALRALEDKVALSRRRGGLAASRGLDAFVERFAVEEQAAEQHASAVRALLRLDGRSGIRPRTNGAGDDAIPLPMKRDHAPASNDPDNGEVLPSAALGPAALGG
jgi:two-component system chemotaxis response regulator CheB